MKAKERVINLLVLPLPHNSLRNPNNIRLNFPLALMRARTREQPNHARIALVPFHWLAQRRAGARVMSGVMREGSRQEAVKIAWDAQRVAQRPTQRFWSLPLLQEGCPRPIGVQFSLDLIRRS